MADPNETVLSDWDANLSPAGTPAPGSLEPAHDADAPYASEIVPQGVQHTYQPGVTQHGDGRNPYADPAILPQTGVPLTEAQRAAQSHASEGDPSWPGRTLTQAQRDAQQRPHEGDPSWTGQGNARSMRTYNSEIDGDDGPDLAADTAFKLADLQSVLKVLRVVRLYENRETRAIALGLLADMGLHDTPEGLVNRGMYMPSEAEQMLADYAASAG